MSFTSIYPSELVCYWSVVGWAVAGLSWGPKDRQLHEGWFLFRENVNKWTGLNAVSARSATADAGSMHVIVLPPVTNKTCRLNISTFERLVSRLI